MVSQMKDRRKTVRKKIWLERRSLVERQVIEKTCYMDPKEVGIEAGE